MHTLGSIDPARSRGPRRRAVALVAGCSLAVAAAFALPAFAGNGSPPKDGDAVSVGCAIANDGTVVAVDSTGVAPLPDGGKVIRGTATVVEGKTITGSIPAGDGPAVMAPSPPAGDGGPAASPVKDGRILVATAAGPDGTVTARTGGGTSTAPKGGPQASFRAVPGRSGAMPKDAPDTGTGAPVAPMEGTPIMIDMEDLPDCGPAAR